MSKKIAVVTDSNSGITQTEALEYGIRVLPMPFMINEETFYEGRDSVLMATSYSFTPEYTTGEKMTKAAMNTAMGMGTVFMVLIFISVLISSFKYINAWENNQKAAKVSQAPAAPVPAPEPMESLTAEDLTEDLELVAVITAAIAAFDSTASADGLVVRSIKRVPGAKWKRA